MKDNARNVPGSSRAAALLSCPFVYIRGGQTNGSKISPKSVCFRECEFFNYSAPTTYNFTPLKRSDFPDTLPSQPIDSQTLTTETRDARLGSPDNAIPSPSGKRLG